MGGFHFGEMTLFLTLEDVFFITGLPITRDPVTGSETTKESAAECLRVRATANFLNSKDKAIKIIDLRMLKQHFKEVDDNNAEFAACAWILCCLGFLFPNTDLTLNHHLLPLLKDFNKVDGHHSYNDHRLPWRQFGFERESLLVVCDEKDFSVKQSNRLPSNGSWEVLKKKQIELYITASTGSTRRIVFLKEVEEIDEPTGEQPSTSNADQQHGGSGEVDVVGEMMDEAEVVGPVHRVAGQHLDGEQPSTSNADQQHGGGGEVDVGGEMMDVEHQDGGGGEVDVGGEMMDVEHQDGSVDEVVGQHLDGEQPSTSNVDQQHGGGGEVDVGGEMMDAEHLDGVGGEVDRVSDIIVRPFDREVITYQRRNRNDRPPPLNADAELNVAPHVTPQPSYSNTVRPRQVVKPAIRGDFTFSTPAGCSTAWIVDAPEGSASDWHPGNSRAQQLEVLKRWVEEKGILFLGYKQFSVIICDTETSKISATYQEILLKQPFIMILDDGHSQEMRILMWYSHLKKYKHLEMLSRSVVKSIMSRVQISSFRKQINANTHDTFYELVEHSLQSDVDFQRKVTVMKDLREMTSEVLHYYKGDFLDELPELVDLIVVLNLSPDKSVKPIS
ncbi:hypothetical protein RND71_035489 [Anisodus tanguticus]|uniref:Uncharacterized protein n=1 Tax=Anisodus tanguticus TaxID=243964 RepID=A0AAE1R5B4_9SOLA|nr:hypothetical protein RND71_035489 [Anisodus tanguticus]